MFSLTSSFRHYLYSGVTDTRKSFNGLSGIVQSKLHRNLMSGEVFIFINRRRDKVKLLRWETGGFIMYYKRLESGTFELPVFKEDTSGAKKIGEVVTEILEYTPGKLYVEKYIRPKYALPAEKGIIIGELPSFPIHRGNAGPGLLSHILISKFTDHLPFYR